MRTDKLKFIRRFFIIAAVAFFPSVFLFQTGARAQEGVKRIVVIKADGLPGDYVDRLVRRRDPQTGKSLLPWFDEIFYKNGTRLANFYSRGMSLSATSWSLLDTGQHLQIKGNVEYDRLVFRSYDYLNFIPYYVRYGLKKRVDMPGAEVLDQLNIPLLIDAFPYQKRYQSYQLFQRGTDWGVLAGGFVNLFPPKPRDFADEWTIGFDFFSTTVNQNERDIIQKLRTHPEIDYFDYFTTDFDHVAHLDNDPNSRLRVLQDLDLTVGRIWAAIKSSPRAAETALVVVSDHGFNGTVKNYSQGFNLVNLLGSAAGGGHHVVTKRHLMLDYSIKGINPFVPLITTASKDSFYLKNQSGDYPTVMLDFDGNERAALHLRDNDLNVLHLLLLQMQKKGASPLMERAAKNAFFAALARRRAEWRQSVDNLNEELNALRRRINSQKSIIDGQPEKFTAADISAGADKDARRVEAQAEIAAQNEAAYREYTRVMSNLLALEPESFNPRKTRIDDYIPKRAMGTRNSVYDLQNYVVGLSADGLSIIGDGQIDLEKSFRRVNYFELLASQIVRNNVQPNVGSRPVDFVAAHVSRDSISSALPPELFPDTDAIWLYGGADKQALILTRGRADENQKIRYLPIADLRQRADGKITFEIKDWGAGFPLKMFEDPNLNNGGANPAAWLGESHTEIEWLHATHKTIYSAAVINLKEQFDEHSLTGFEDTRRNFSEDEKLIHRFRRRQRLLTETDLLVLANNHWNFDVRGFNSGGNHGSFFRVSANSTLMLAGGANTNIPRGLTVEEPYDNLSFAPTVFKLMNKTQTDNEPLPDLYRRGFRKFPGRIIREIFGKKPD